MSTIAQTSFNGYSRPAAPMPAYAASQAHAAQQNIFVHAPASLAYDFNPRLEALRQDINDIMTPGQKHAARTVAIIGTLVSLGGAAAAGYFGMTALVGFASGIGIPVVAAAAIAGAATGFLGLGATVLISAWLRAATRKKLRHHPALENRLQTLRLLRGQLLAMPRLDKANKQLLRNTNKVLSKVEGPGAMIKAQLKTVAITTFSVPLFAIYCGISAAAVAVDGPFAPNFLGGGGGDIGFPGTGGELKRCSSDEIGLANAQDYLTALNG